MGAGTDTLTAAGTLQAAIADAWQVFNVPTPDDIGVCVGCCLDPDIAAEMLATPARDLTAAHLREWFYAADDSTLGHHHMAWILTRQFALLDEGWDFDYQSAETLLLRMVGTGYPGQWPPAEVACVQRLCAALWQTRLEDSDPARKRGVLDPCLDDWLCMMANGLQDVQPLLDRLWALPDDRLVGLLQADWIANWPKGFIRFSPFWRDAPAPARQQAWAFYTAPALAARLLACALAGNDSALALAALVEAAAGSAPPH
jgi:hypothetical protein